MSDETMQQEDFEIAFQKASQFVKKNPDLFKDEQKLKLYALFKQSTVGDCNIEKPGVFFGWYRKAMWDEWNSLKEKNIKNPHQMYVDYLTSQIKGWESVPFS